MPDPNRLRSLLFSDDMKMLLIVLEIYVVLAALEAAVHDKTLARSLRLIRRWITRNPDVRGGSPVISRTRVAVRDVIELLREHSMKEVAELLEVPEEAVEACVQYALLATELVDLGILVEAEVADR